MGMTASLVIEAQHEAQSSDRPALNRLLTHSQVRIYSLVILKISCRETALDIVQEVLRKLMEKVGECRYIMVGIRPLDNPREANRALSLSPRAAIPGFGFLLVASASR